jgi:hypothetical protein
VTLKNSLQRAQENREKTKPSHHHAATRYKGTRQRAILAQNLSDASDVFGDIAQTAKVAYQGSKAIATFNQPSHLP